MKETAINRNKFLYKSFFAIFLFFFFMGICLRAEAATVKYEILRNDKTKTYVGKNIVEAEIYFDRVVLKGKSSAINKINKKIKSESDKFLKSSNIKSLRSYAKNHAKNSTYDITMSCTATSKVIYNKKNIISIQIDTFWFAGGVSNTERYGMTFNLKTGKLLKLTDVCKGNASSIKKQIVNKAKKIKDITSSGYGLDVIKSYSTKNFDFYINKKGKAVVCFAPYEIAYGGWYRTITLNSKYI